MTLLEGSLVTWNVEPPVQGRVIEVTIDLDGDLWASLAFRGNDKDVKVLVEDDVLLNGTPAEALLQDGSLTTNVGKRFYGWDGATYRCVGYNQRGYDMQPEIIDDRNPTTRSLSERAIGGTFFEIAEDGRVKGLLGAPNCLEPRPLTRENFHSACEARKASGFPAI
jgi:hypothetical protein